MMIAVDNIKKNQPFANRLGAKMPGN